MKYIEQLNKEYGTALTGYSPRAFSQYIPSDKDIKIVVKDFGNGLGRVLYIDKQNRLIANLMEKL